MDINEYLNAVRNNIGSEDSSRLKLILDSENLCWMWAYELDDGTLATSPDVSSAPQWFNDLPWDYDINDNDLSNNESKLVTLENNEIVPRLWELP